MAHLQLPTTGINSLRRVVVTGLGLVTPLGVGVEHSWSNLLKGKCGVTNISTFDCDGLSVNIAALVPRGKNLGDFNLEDWVDSRNKRTQGVDFIAFAISAAKQAINDSGWIPTCDEERERTGVAIGAGIGSLEHIMDNAQYVKEKQYRKISPYFIPQILINLAAGHVSINHGLKGPNHSCVTACATGAHSIGDAYRFIKFGDADRMVAGGTEASINALSVAGFSRAKALTTKFNDQPQAASRPFDSLRDGFVMGEGAGVLFLEEYEHALKRGANIYAEIRGYGLSGDAYHITAPSSDGNGAQRAMRSALSQSGLNLSDIDYINAHATSTPLGDLVENTAVKQVFGAYSSQLAISSTKGATGHLLGAAGAVEAIFSIKALKENIAPPTLNLNTLDRMFDLNYVPLIPQEKNIRAVLSNSFGFGGTNACLCFSEI